jgi:hypothetical protein
MKLDPALNVPCPTCHVKAGQPCRSRRAISIHRDRRGALADLSAQAAQLLSASPGSRKPAQRKNGTTTPPKPVLIGKTGEENVIPEDAEYWPPWEPPPVPGCLAESGITVTGMVWCPVHQEYEELRDGVSAVRLAARMRG